MSQPQLLSRVVRVLDSLGIDYMITGSIASSIQGEPRSTHDIDIVVDVPTEATAPLTSAFPPPDFLLQEAAVRDALKNQTMFNLLSLGDGEKVDFWILTNEPFDRSRFSRRRTFAIGDEHMNVSAPEDTILMKLRWAKQCGGSEKQFKDALRVFEVQARSLDSAYLDEWSNRLGVQDLWRQIQDEAEIV
jgi:hypothetical protein